MVKSKSQKQVERRKKIEHNRNVMQNQGKPRYLLYIKVDGGWKAVMRFKTITDVDKHCESMEDIRKRNASELVEANIVEVKTGKVIRHVAPHKVSDPAMLSGSLVAKV
jgi:hypothetical protein